MKIIQGKSVDQEKKAKNKYCTGYVPGRKQKS